MSLSLGLFLLTGHHGPALTTLHGEGFEHSPADSSVAEVASGALDPTSASSPQLLYVRCGAQVAVVL